MGSGSRLVCHNAIVHLQHFIGCDVEVREATLVELDHLREALSTWGSSRRGAVIDDVLPDKLGQLIGRAGSKDFGKARRDAYVSVSILLLLPCGLWAGPSLIAWMCGPNLVFMASTTFIVK